MPQRPFPARARTAEESKERRAALSRRDARAGDRKVTFRKPNAATEGLLLGLKFRESFGKAVYIDKILPNTEAARLEKQGKILFVGRLANYKYFDMDKAIDNALELFYQAAWQKLFTGRRFATFKDETLAKMQQAQRDRQDLPWCRAQGNLSTPFYHGEFGMELRVMVPWAYHKSRGCRRDIGEI